MGRIARSAILTDVTHMAMRSRDSPALQNTNSIKLRFMKYGTSVRENLNCNIIDKYLRFGVHCDS